RLKFRGFSLPLSFLITNNEVSTESGSGRVTTRVMVEIACEVNRSLPLSVLTSLIPATNGIFQRDLKRDRHESGGQSSHDILRTKVMAEYVCRLGTPAGEIVTRTVEAMAAHEARARLEREGFKVFTVTPPKTEGVASLTRLGGAGGRARVKPNDFLLFNQQLAALLRAGIPILQ